MAAFLLFLILARYSQAEIIDGPANVRNMPSGTILFELYDYIHVFKETCDGDWCSIRLRVEVSEDAMDGNKIKANQNLRYSLKDSPIGRTIKEINLSSPDRRTPGVVSGVIFGFTHKKNIRTEISTDLKKLFELVPGYYVISDIVDEKQKQYWPSRYDNIPHIFFGEIEIRKVDTDLIFSFDDFHDKLASGFVIHENGSVDGNICFAKYCINKITPLDKKTFSIDISGQKPTTLISTIGLQEMFESEDETPK